MGREDKNIITGQVSVLRIILAVCEKMCRKIMHLRKRTRVLRKYMKI